MKAAIRRCAYITVLVDQHFAGGLDVDFFEDHARPRRRRRGSPAAGLAHPGNPGNPPPDQRCIELVGLITPRDAGGRVDVAATMQAITTIVEDGCASIRINGLLHRRWR